MPLEAVDEPTSKLPSSRKVSLMGSAFLCNSRKRAKAEGDLGAPDTHNG